MRILVVMVQKGGGGKTTIALHLAVAASEDGQKVALVDLDPQKSATKWHGRRNGRNEPILATATAEDLPALIEKAKAAGVDLLVIDTAPHNDDAAVKAARTADLLLVPCRPSPLDLDAIGASMNIGLQTRRPMAVVLSACPPPRRLVGQDAAVVAETREVLERKYGARTVPGQITNLAAYSHALIEGAAVTEFEPRGRAAGEINALWTWVKGEMRNGAA